jgi:hypothetical protein
MLMPNFRALGVCLLATCGLLVAACLWVQSQAAGAHNGLVGAIVIVLLMAAALGVVVGALLRGAVLAIRRR